MDIYRIKTVSISTNQELVLRCAQLLSDITARADNKPGTHLQVDRTEHVQMQRLTSLNLITIVFALIARKCVVNPV